jgi:rRNA maturation endonuclease Nob1
MGLFENLGRKVESFKRDATENAAEPTSRCEDCDAEFFTDYETCPDCGSEAVSLIE